MSAPRLGLDIGGTKIAVGVVTAAGEVLARRHMPTDRSLDGKPFLRCVADLAEEASRDLGLHPREMAGVGVALPAPVDPRTQSSSFVPDLPGLNQFSIAPFLRTLWQRDDPGWVRVDNDANAAALGEAVHGAGRGGRLVCYLTVSTGIGGGVVFEGQVFRGATGQAAEFGHLKLREDGPPCRCGDRGCLEALASGTGIGRRAREAALSGEGELQMLALADASKPTAAEVAAAVRRGDPLARAVWEAAMTDLGAGVVSVIHAYNPDIVVLGGGVSRSADLLLPPVRRVVAERAMPMLAAVVRIEAAALGDDVGVVGATALLDERSM